MAQALFVMPGCKLEVWDKSSGLEDAIKVGSRLRGFFSSSLLFSFSTGGEEGIQPGQLQEHEG